MGVCAPVLDTDSGAPHERQSKQRRQQTGDGRSDELGGSERAWAEACNDVIIDAEDGADDKLRGIEAAEATSEVARTLLFRAPRGYAIALVRHRR